MFKNLFVLMSIAGLTACTGVGDGSITFAKTGEVAGSAGLDIATKKCAPLEGTRDWQICVAHYDGLYTKSNGIIKRSYERSADASKPTGQVEKCNITATWDSKAATWSYSSCESHK